MYSPHFEKSAAQIPELPRKAQNDAVYEADREKRKLNLFRKRKAHEINSRLGWRNKNIDQNAIANVMKEMRALNCTEDEYAAFLSESLEETSH